MVTIYPSIQFLFASDSRDAVIRSTSQPEINFGKVLTYEDECSRYNDMTRVFSMVPFCPNLKDIHFVAAF